MTTSAPDSQPSGSLPARPGRFVPRLLPWPLAVLIVLLVHAFSLWWVPQLHLNNAPDLYYPAGSEAVEIRDALRAEFPSDELLTVVFQGPDLYGRNFLERLDGLATALSRHPLVDRVTTLTNMEHIQGSDDGFSVAPLVDVKRLSRMTPEQVQQRVLGDRFAPGLLASRDGSTVAMAVRPKPLEGSADRLALKVAVITAIRDGGLERYFAGDAGPITVDVAQLVSMMNDTTVFVPLTAGLGLLLLAWVVGRLVPVVIGGVAMSTVILPTVAGIAVSGQPYSMATAILPSLLAAYTMATLMHLYAAIQRAHAGGLRQRESIRMALAETIRPGAFNVLTTSAGLLSLMLVPMPPIQAFGIAGAAGTAMVFVVVYFVVPSLLVRFDRRRWPVKRSTMGFLGRLAQRITMKSMRRPKLAIAGAVLLVLGCVPLALKVHVETDVLAFFAPDHPVNVATNIVETKLSGITSLELLLQAPARDGLADIDTLKAIRELQDWLEALPEVDRTTSHVDLIEEMHWAMNGERQGFRKLPDSQELVSQYLLVYDGKDLEELVDRDFKQGRILLNMNVHGARQIGASIERIRQHVSASPLPGATVQIGGYGRLFADQVDLLVAGQADSFLGAFGQIFLLMTLLWRSPVAAAFCMVPNLAPLFFVFVLMGTFGISLDMATVMIAGVVLGITVDDTIHLYHGYRERLRAGTSVPLALARSFQNSGRAVLAISVLLTAQFALLATSDFIPTANFGLMTAVGLLAGQAAELLLLPALLVLRDGRKPRVQRSPAGHQRALPSGMRMPAPSETLWPPAEQPSSGLEAPQEVAPTPPSPTVAPTGLVLVCRGEVCRAKGSETVWEQCRDAYVMAKATGRPLQAVPVESPCLRRCEHAPVVLLANDPSAMDADDVDVLATLAKAAMTQRGGAT